MLSHWVGAYPPRGVKQNQKSINNIRAFIAKGYRTMKNLISGIFAIMLIIAAASATTSIEVPAVDAEGNGVLSEISVSATPGTGDIFMSIKPLTGVDTQHSEKTAVELASRLAGVDTSKYDLLFKIESTAEVVDGPSAGAALALLSFAELSGKRMRSDLTITGSIDSEGHVGKIGGVFEKAKAVSEDSSNRYRVFLIPRGQRIQSGVDVAKYAREKWSLQVAEVDTILDVLDYAFNTSEGSDVVVKEKIIPPLKLIPFKASKESEAFREIAANEVQEAQKRLKDAMLTEEVLASLEESMNISTTLLGKGYFYSAANSAFLASISLDELSFVNGTKPELSARLRELKVLADGFEFAKQTEGNFEWVIGAKLRYYWATGKLSEAEDKISLGNYMSAAGDLAVATSWLRAASRMNSIAKGSEIGAEMKDSYFRGIALERLNAAKALEEDGSLDNEALDHLQTAAKEFEAADYLAAMYDATFATAYAAAYERMGDNTYEGIVRILCKTGTFELDCAIFKDKAHASLWAELYYAHALYNIQDSNRTREAGSLVNGVKLIELSNGFEAAHELALETLKNPPASNEPLPPSSSATARPGTKQLRVEVTAVTEDSGKQLILFSVIGLIALLAVYALVLRKKPVSPSLDVLGDRGKLERAEELLLQGRISEKSFDYFKSKYKADAGRDKKGKRPPKTPKAGKRK